VFREEKNSNQEGGRPAVISPGGVYQGGVCPVAATRRKIECGCRLKGRGKVPILGSK